MAEGRELQEGRQSTAITALRVSPVMLLTVLGLAQFINTYDTTAMNVAVSRVVVDLHTTVTGVQLALTSYALVMAAFMILGGKLGDVFGRDRTFKLGVALYGVGALTTALAPNLTVMIIGWSVLEGIGSALMIPAIYAIIPAVFPPGKERVKAFAVIGSVAGAGAAFGPLLCGIITTYSTWRVSFAMEVVVVIVLLAMTYFLKPPKVPSVRPKFDWVGGVLSALGLGLLVLGILQANTLATRGWTPVLSLTITGAVVLVCFVAWEAHRKRVGKAQLIDPAMLRIKQVKLGLPLTSAQTFMMSGALFIIPVFQQMALGFSPMMSGLTFLPNTIAMVVVSQIAGRLTMRYGRRVFVFAGLVCMSAGIGLVALMVSTHSSFWNFLPGTLVMGIGLGLVMAPLLDLVQSSVPANQQSEASGVNRAFFNLGSSLGTAVAGAVLISVLIAGLTGLISQSKVFTPQQKSNVTGIVQKDAHTMSDAQLRQLLTERGQTDKAYVDELVRINSEARETSLRVALGVVAMIGLALSILALLLPKDRDRGQALNMEVPDP